MTQTSAAQANQLKSAVPPYVAECKATPKLPLLVSPDYRSATISKTGQSFSLEGAEVARWLKILAERPNVWISSAELGRLDSELLGQRVERLRKQLPRTIAKLVESKRGKGARLRAS